MSPCLRFVSVSLAFVLLVSCQQELEGPPEPAGIFSLRDSSGACLPDRVHGFYTAGVPLNSSHFLDVQVWVTRPGTLALSSNMQNGISFAGAARLPTGGLATMRLTGSGSPLAPGTTLLQLTLDGQSCPVAIPVAPAPAGGNPMGNPCFGTIAGTFRKDSALGPGHQIMISHVFQAAGNLTATTDTVNGYSFRKELNVPVIGAMRTVAMEGAGTPRTAGSDTFTVRFGDGTYCRFRVVVE